MSKLQETILSLRYQCRAVATHFEVGEAQIETPHPFSPSFPFHPFLSYQASAPFKIKVSTWPEQGSQNL